MVIAAVHGFLLALGLILPLGVQNVFVFNQGALQKRFIHAIPAIITASLSDTLLIVLAVLGVSVVVLNSVWLRFILLLAGILFLLYMGWMTWRAKPNVNETREERIFTPPRQIVFAASVSLLNPHAIMDTIGVIGTSSISYSGPEKFIFTLSCILVSWLWFTGLALAGRITGELDKSGRFIQTINKVSALVMWGSAGYISFLLVFR